MRVRGSYHSVQDKLLQAFQQVTSSVQYLNQLLLKVQSEQESFKTYTYNKLKLCENLNKEMTETDKVTYLIQAVSPQFFFPFTPVFFHFTPVFFSPQNLIEYIFFTYFYYSSKQFLIESTMSTKIMADHCDHG